MQIAQAAKLFAARSVWRTLGSTAAGRALLGGLGSPDEDVRTLAGMLLVRSGKRAEPLLEEALDKRLHLPVVLTILGDLGDPAAAPRLRQFSDDPDIEVARAAREALATLAVGGQ